MIIYDWALGPRPPRIRWYVMGENNGVAMGESAWSTSDLCEMRVSKLEGLKCMGLHRAVSSNQVTVNK